MPSRSVRWHDDWIRQNYLSYPSYEAMVRDYNRIFDDHVTKAGMNNHCRLKLGLKKPRMNCRHYTDEQIEWLKENLPKFGRNETCRMFNERFNESRTVRAMKSFTMMYGVKVNEEVWKAHVTYNVNKDKLKDVGTERIDHGRAVVKCEDGKWRYKNRIVYEQQNGRIPKGHCVVHLDNDPLNCKADNLMAVPHRIMSMMAGGDMYSEHPLITKTAIQWCVLADLLKQQGVKETKQWTSTKRKSVKCLHLTSTHA